MKIKAGLAIFLLLFVGACGKQESSGTSSGAPVDDTQFLTSLGFTSPISVQVDFSNVFERADTI